MCVLRYVLVYGLGNTLVCVSVSVLCVYWCVCVCERERGGGGSTQKEKVQEERAQCYQHVLLFFHLFVHYQHIKHYILLTSLRLGQLSGVWMDGLSPGNRSGVWSTKPMKLK